MIFLQQLFVWLTYLAVQTIVTINLGYALLSLDTQPFVVDDSAAAPLATQCPIGSVVPDRPADPAVEWIGGEAKDQKIVSCNTSFLRNWLCCGLSATHVHF